MQRVVPSEMSASGTDKENDSMKPMFMSNTEVDGSSPAPGTSVKLRERGGEDKRNDEENKSNSAKTGIIDDEMSITFPPTAPVDGDACATDVEAAQEEHEEEGGSHDSRGSEATSASANTGVRPPTVSTSRDSKKEGDCTDFVVPTEIFLDEAELRRHARIHEIYRKIDEGKEERRRRNEAKEEKRLRQESLEREEDVKEKPDLRLQFLRLAIAILVVGSVFAVIYDTIQRQWIRSFLERTLRWIEANPNAGFFPIVGVLFLGTVFFIPSEFMCLGCGYIYAQSYGTGLGIFHAVTAVAVGSSLGAVFSFHLCRFVIRQWIEEKYVKNDNPVIYALDRILRTRKSIVAMICFGLSLLLPVSGLNYLAGASSISGLHFCIGWLAQLPNITLYVVLGATFSDGLEHSASRIENATLSLVELLEGSLAVGAGMIYLYLQVRVERRIVEAESLNNCTSFITVPAEKNEPNESSTDLSEKKEQNASNQNRGCGCDEILETPGYDEPEGPVNFLEQSGTSWSTFGQ